MVISYEQWEIILGTVNQEVDLSEDNVIEKIKEKLLKTETILGQAEISRMLEKVSHELEVSSKIPRVQETQEPLKKRLKMVNIPQAMEKAKKRLKESRVSNEQQTIKRMLKRLGVQETSEESKAATLEDVLDARKISEKVPVMLDTKEILKVLNGLKKASKGEYKKWEKVGFNVNHWFTLTYETWNGHDQRTLLGLAISLRLKYVEDALIKLKTTNINTKSPFSGYTALHCAAAEEDVKTLSELVERGANVNEVDLFQQNPLYISVKNGNIEIIKILIKSKININNEDIEKSTALHKAVYNRNEEIVKILLLSKADVKKDINGNTPLHLAVFNNYVKIVRSIVVHDAKISTSIDMVNESGNTALHLAAENKDVSILEILLQNGADYHLENRLAGFTPLHIAVINKNLKAIEILLTHNKKLSDELKKILDSLKRSKVTHFSRNNTDKDLEQIETLLEQNEEYINMRDTKGWSAFDHAVTQKDKNIKIIETLISFGANIDVKDPLKILLAISPLNVLEAHLLLKKLQIYDYMVELIRAYYLRCSAKYDDRQTVLYLKESGVNVNSSDDLGSTALHEASLAGNLEMVKLLISYEAKVNVCNDMKLTPLHNALENIRRKVAEFLISNHDIDCSLQDKCGETVKDLDERKGTSHFSDKAEKRILALKKKIQPIIESAIGERVTADSIEACPGSSTEINKVEIQRAHHSPYRWGPRTINANSGRVTPLADGIEYMKLEPNTEACPSPSTEEPSTHLFMIEKISSPGTFKKVCQTEKK